VRIPRQNGLAVALRDLRRIERTLFTLEWLQNIELRRASRSDWDPDSKWTKNNAKPVWNQAVSADELPVQDMADLWPYRGISRVAEPTPMGHECCGIVEEVGSAVIGAAACERHSLDSLRSNPVLNGIAQVGVSSFT
jgi:hypothetical protein